MCTWIHVAQNRDKRRRLVNKVKMFGFQKCGKCVIGFHKMQDNFLTDELLLAFDEAGLLCSMANLLPNFHFSCKPIALPCRLSISVKFSNSFTHLR